MVEQIQCNTTQKHRQRKKMKEAPFGASTSPKSCSLSLYLSMSLLTAESSRFLSWVAHTKEEARQTAAQEANLPAISHKTWQAENPDVLLGRTRQTSACHCSSPSGLPTNCGAPFSTLPESLTSFTVHLRAHPCPPACMP